MRENYFKYDFSVMSTHNFIKISSKLSICLHFFDDIRFMDIIGLLPYYKLQRQNYRTGFPFTLETIECRKDNLNDAL